MIHGRSRRRIAMYERERWTRDLVDHAVAATDCLNQGRLTRSELAAHGDHQRRICHTAEAFAPRDQFGFTEREMAVCREWRNDRSVRHLSAASGGRAYLRSRSVAPRAQLEQLVAELRRQLEVHRRRRLAHLLIEHL